MRTRLLLLSLAMALVTPTTSAESDGPVCGRPGKPPCPLQHWMRQQVAAPLFEKDGAALERSLEQLAGFNPEPQLWPNWSALAKRGATLARQGQFRQAKKVCGRCHRQFRRKYNERHRLRPIAPPTP